MFQLFRRLVSRPAAADPMPSDGAVSSRPAIQSGSGADDASAATALIQLIQLIAAPLDEPQTEQLGERLHQLLRLAAAPPGELHAEEFAQLSIEPWELHADRSTILDRVLEPAPHHDWRLSISIDWKASEEIEWQARGILQTLRIVVDDEWSCGLEDQEPAFGLMAFHRALAPLGFGLLFIDIDGDCYSAFALKLDSSDRAIELARAAGIKLMGAHQFEKRECR